MSKFEAFKRLLNPETGNLIARFKQELWDTIKEKQEEGDIEWLKKNLQRKKGSLERYNAMLKERQKSAKGMYPDHMENGKIVKSNVALLTLGNTVGIIVTALLTIWPAIFVIITELFSTVIKEKFCIFLSPVPQSFERKNTLSSGTASNIGKEVIAVPYESEPLGWFGLYSV